MSISIDSTSASDYGSYTSSLLDEFTLGDKKYSPNAASLYVCHTSTIPLCTTFDLDFERKLFKKGNYFLKEYHGFSEKHLGPLCCNNKYCMFVSKDKIYLDNYISPTCPCLEHHTDKQLSPLCFLSVLKALSHNLVEGEITLRPKEVLWCPDARGILDNEYPALISGSLNLSGFGHLTKNKVIKTLGKLYWFRKYNKKYRLEHEITALMAKKPFGSFLQDLKQTLHSINGLLIKKFLALGPECVDYREIAEQTARLFRDFSLDYGASQRNDIPDFASESIFEDCKDFFNYVKEFHEHADLETRISFLNYRFRNRSLGAFFGQEFRRLYGRIHNRISNNLGDYTQTLAWDYRCVEICQTRNLGYLPEWKAKENDLKYREKISREPEPLSEETDGLIRYAVRNELLRGGVPEGLLSGEKFNTIELIKDSVTLELKYAASANTTVAQGGKPEDARQYLQAIRENGWRIPIRSLNTLEVIGMTPLLARLKEDNDDGFDLSSILFWFAFQNVLNWCLERRLILPNEGVGLYFPFKIGEKRFSIDIMRAKIILVNEPGKGRILVKSESILNWFLVPGSKMCQKVLAYHPDHKAGLELGSHDWVHNKRISGDSAESSFMYDPTSGRLRPNVTSGYTDWTEATDGMKRRIGISHLRGLFEYSGFPRLYGKMIQIMIREPQNVSEVIRTTVSDNYEDTRSFKWEGKIREGFMMGNQITKTLLHLAHISERGVAEIMLNDSNIDVKRNIYGRKTQAYGRVPYNKGEVGGLKTFRSTNK